MRQIGLFFGCHTYESRHTYTRVMSHRGYLMRQVVIFFDVTRMSHGTRINESCHTQGRGGYWIRQVGLFFVVIHMSNGTRTHESCHAQVVLDEAGRPVFDFT